MPSYDDPIYNIRFEIIQIILNELYKTTDDNIRIKLNKFVSHNNGLHEELRSIGGIIYGANKYLSDTPGSDIVRAYVLHESLEPQFKDFLHQINLHNIHKTYSKRLLSIMFNMQPNFDQLSEALGPRLIGVAVQALAPQYRSVVEKTLKASPPSPDFPTFYEKHREYFKLLQEQVIRNMLLKTKSGETK